MDVYWKIAHHNLAQLHTHICFALQSLPQMYWVALHSNAMGRYPDPFHSRLCRLGQQDCQIVASLWSTTIPVQTVQIVQSHTCTHWDTEQYKLSESLPLVFNSIINYRTTNFPKAFHWYSIKNNRNTNYRNTNHLDASHWNAVQKSCTVLVWLCWDRSGSGD